MSSLLPFPARLRALRRRRGLSRPVLGGLVGRGAEWVKALENGRIQMPRLDMLLRLAEVLGVQDLADLTGGLPLPVDSLRHCGPGRDAEMVHRLAQRVVELEREVRRLRSLTLTDRAGPAAGTGSRAPHSPTRSPGLVDRDRT